MRRALAAFGLALALSPSVARAQSAGDEMPDFMKKPVVAERRSGFTFGVLGGALLFSGHGTPLAYTKRDAVHEVSVGPALSPDIAFFLGDALADEVSFTFELEPSSARQGDLRLRGSAFAFRIETWPLFWRGGVWRDLGIAPRFGFGSTNFTRVSDGATVASSSTYSLVGADLIWDTVRLGGWGLGPTLGMAYRFSDTYAETTVLFGVRIAHY